MIFIRLATGQPYSQHKSLQLFRDKKNIFNFLSSWAQKGLPVFTIIQYEHFNKQSSLVFVEAKASFLIVKLTL